jgi:hypothetical protein
MLYPTNHEVSQLANKMYVRHPKSVPDTDSVSNVQWECEIQVIIIAHGYYSSS